MSELKKCYEALDALAASNTIRKGIDSKLSIKQQRAIAIAKATRTPAGAALARRILQLEKQQAVSFAFSVPVAASMGAFRKADPDDLFEQIKENEREHAELIRRLKEARGDYEEEDDWSSQFSEA